MNQGTQRLKTFLTEGTFPVKGQCAIHLLMTRVDIINLELSMELDRNVIQMKSGRIKTNRTTCSKLENKGLQKNIPTALKKIHDLIGVRAICSYVDDIYRIAEILSEQKDVKVMKVKDYIKNPKDSGYRSLHMILEIPIAFQGGTQWMKTELQLRTAGMDYWANLDHQLRYKRGRKEAEVIDAELRECADMVGDLDTKMLEMRRKIDKI